MSLYKQIYTSPLGDLSLVADDLGLLGVWFVGQKYFEQGLDKDDLPIQSTTILDETKEWLDAYFAGDNPSVTELPLLPRGTAFQKRVWQVLSQIPQGETLTYGEIAAQIGCHSARAVGGAVSRNPLSIIVPCHRVLGATGQVTGYAAGRDKKRWLLKHEGVLLDK